MADYFQTLPPEIVLHIFGFLPAETLRCAVSLVSKTFRDYANCDKLWTTVRYRYRPGTAAVFGNFLQKQKRVQELSMYIQDMFYTLFCPDYSFPELTSLTKLVLKGARYCNFIHLKNNYPNLKELELIGMHLLGPIQSGNCHSEVDCPTENISVIGHLCMKFQKLEKLTIQETPCIEWNHLRFWGETLKELKITRQRLLYFELEIITESCTRLETFHFETVCYIRDISDLLARLPLKDLALTMAPYEMYGPELAQDVTNRSICKLFQGLPELVRFAFNARSRFLIDNSVLEFLTVHCKKMEVVKLMNMPSVTNAGIMCLITGLKNLKELHLLNCVNCDKDKLEARLISSNKKVKFVYYSSF